MKSCVMRCVDGRCECPTCGMRVEMPTHLRFLPHLCMTAEPPPEPWRPVKVGDASENDRETRVSRPLHQEDTPQMGLGDMVAAGLSAIGITKERVSAAVGGDCGCAKRQQQLNALGRRIGIG